MAEKKTNLSIEERMDILQEFIDFYDEQPVSFCIPKKVALQSMYELMRFAEEEEGGLDDEVVERVLTEAIAPLDTDELAERFDFNALEKSFFEWGIWLAIWVLSGDEKTIDRHREMMKNIEDLWLTDDEKELANSKEWQGIAEEILIQIKKLRG